MAMRATGEENDRARSLRPKSSILLIVWVGLWACGDSSGPPGTTNVSPISGRARLLTGPSAPSSPSAARVRREGLSVVPTAGRYTLSPDQARVTVRSLNFFEASGGQSADLTNCSPTYSRASASLATLLECPFEVRPGTYVGIGVNLSSTFSVLIDDAEGGFFSDPATPSRLAIARPSAGPQFVSFKLPGETIGIQVLFARPLVVDSATARTGLTISLVIDMIHTMFVNVENGIAVFDTIIPNSPVNVVPFVGAPGRAEVYSATGTARTARLGGPTSTDLNSIHLYYDSSGQPIYLISVIGTGIAGSAWSANPATTPLSLNDQRAGGFLGLDSSGTLCWAIPTDLSWRQYVQVRTMRPVANVGATTTLSIQQTSTVPQPASGDTYASGCPAAGPGRATLTLVAK